jgi:hypothetical protein
MKPPSFRSDSLVPLSQLFPASFGDVRLLWARLGCLDSHTAGGKCVGELIGYGVARAVNSTPKPPVQLSLAVPQVGFPGGCRRPARQWPVCRGSS